MVAIFWVTLNSYKVLVARAIKSETVDIVPFYFCVGDGASFTNGEPDPPEPGDTALANQLSQATLEAHTIVGYQNKIVGRIPGGAALLTINECGFKTKAGVFVARATFKPVNFQSPFDYLGTLLMQPELQ